MPSAAMSRNSHFISWCDFRYIISSWILLFFFILYWFSAEVYLYIIYNRYNHHTYAYCFGYICSKESRHPLSMGTHNCWLLSTVDYVRVLYDHLFLVEEVSYSTFIVSTVTGLFHSMLVRMHFPWKYCHDLWFCLPKKAHLGRSPGRSRMYVISLSRECFHRFSCASLMASMVRPCSQSNDFMMAPDPGKVLQ